MTRHRTAPSVCRYPLPAALVLLMLVATAGCGGRGDFRPSAVGQEGEIVVVVDSSNWNGAIGEALRSTIGRYIGTLPAPERMFELRAVQLRTESDLDDVRRRKNVVFVAPLSDTTNEARYLKNVFDAEAQETIRNGDGAVISRPDLWRRHQQVFYVTGATRDDVVEALHEEGDEMNDAFNAATRGRVGADMFEKGRQYDLEDTLMERHGFAVSVQHDYVIALDTTDFVWLRRILPDTWRSLFVYYEDDADPAVLTPEWIYATRDSLTRRYIQGEVSGWVEIDRRRPLETEHISFLDRYGFETRGLWHLIERENGEMIEWGMGGPFLTYAFYDQGSGRLYLIDGMVHAPGFSKREFLRQMEVIAHTFRTRQDEAQRDREVAAR